MASPDGSVGGSKGFASLSVYDATKAAVRSFAPNWILDLKPRKIRINVVSPGVIETPGLDVFMDEEISILGGESAERQLQALGRHHAYVARSYAASGVS
jgi:NAD(P)-dependent dehydrogenase (short-subunit alcohol dehydrogenase family)